MTPAAGQRVRPPRPQNPKQLLELCAASLLAKKAMDLSVLEVGQLTGYADYLLLASGRSTRHATAMAQGLLRVLKKAGVRPLGSDGLREGRWILVDFGDVVVHIFHQPVREFYDLESLWEDAPRLELDSAALAGLVPPGGED